MQLKSVAMIAIALIVAGCASKEVASTPRSITFENVNRGNLDAAYEKAKAHCNKHGRQADFVPDSWQAGYATFKCIGR